MKKTTNTLAVSSIILILSTAMVKIISAFFKIPLASDKFLGEVGFGYFSVAHDIYMPFYLLAITGLPVAVSHIVAEKVSKNAHNDVLKSFYSCRRLFTLLGVIISSSLFLIVLMLCAFFEKSNSYYCILAVVPSIFLCFVISAYRGFFEGYSDMYPTAISKVIEAVSKLFLGLLFVYLALKLTKNIAMAAVLGIIAVTLGTALSTLYLHLKFRRCNNSNIVETNSRQKGQLKLYLSLSLPFVFAGLTSSIVALLDVFCVKVPLSFVNDSYINTVATQIGETYMDFSALLYGIRSKAFTVYNLIPTFTATLGVGALPIITALSVKEEKKALKQNVNYTLKLISVITFPAAIGLCVLSSQIMYLLYSDVSLLGANLLKIYGIAALFSGFSIPLITVLQALDKIKAAIVNIAVAIFLKIISSLILVSFPKINIYAAAYSTLICYLYLFVAVFILLYKTIGKCDIKNTILKPLLCAVLCGICAYSLSQISSKNIVTAIAIFVTAVVYALFIILTKTFSKAEIAQIPLVNRLLK